MNVLGLKETMLINKFGFLEKTMFFLVRPETYRVMCYTHSLSLENTARAMCTYEKRESTGSAKGEF